MHFNLFFLHSQIMKRTSQGISLTFCDVKNKVLPSEIDKWPCVFLRSIYLPDLNLNLILIESRNGIKKIYGLQVIEWRGRQSGDAVGLPFKVIEDPRINLTQTGGFQSRGPAPIQLFLGGGAVREIDMNFNFFKKIFTTV